MKACKEGTMRPYDVDKSLFELTHDDVAAALLEYWNLPAEIVEGVRLHHRDTNGNVFPLIMQIAAIVEESDSAMPHDPEAEKLAVEWAVRLQEEFNLNPSPSTK
jgi:HD-like signal output (HDOD) protein